jgi:hypothetical protein
MKCENEWHDPGRKENNSVSNMAWLVYFQKM